MDTYEIIGIEKKTGEYQNKPYENYYFYCKNLVAANICGITVTQFKISSKNIGEIIKGYKLESMLGMKITPYYNKYQQVIKFDFAK